MSSRFNATLVISLCMTSGLPLACDAPDDDLDAELDDIEAPELDAVDELSAAPQATAGQGSSKKLAKGWVRRPASTT